MKRILLFSLAVFVMGFSQAQKYGNTPEDSIECVKNLSIYQEFYKQRAYEDSYASWKEVMKYCPTSSLNNYIRGNVIIKNVINKHIREKNAEAIQKSIDELLSLWDLRKENFGQPGFCLGMKARDLNTYRPSQIAEANKLYTEALKYTNERGFYPIIFFYFENIVKGVKEGIYQKEAIFEAYDLANSLLEEIQDRDPEDTMIGNTLKTLDVAFEPYATCSELVPIYQKKFEQSKNDLVFLKKVTKMLSRKECTDSPLFFSASAALYNLEPTPQSAYLMAQMTYAKKDYASVVKYLAKTVENMEKDNDKANAYLLLANSYLNLGQYSAGRDAANEVIMLNPNEGRAYLIIGNLYAASAKNCGDEPQVSQRAAYWAAVDKFIKAKQVDPSIADVADKSIATFVKHFPSGDDLFFFGIKEGSSYRVGCWINENTTVRASK